MIARIILIVSILALGCQLKAQSDSLFREINTTISTIIHEYQDQEEYLVGGVVTVVSPDTVFFLKGFGLSDLENEKPFDPYSTLVDVASVTKIITATAVLQLWEKGVIDIYSPVSKYLQDVSIDKRVTIEQLLTHTAGLDDRMSLMDIQTLADQISLKEYNTKYLPEVVWPPGEFFNYSNYSFNLLAYLVESVSGLAFHDYVKKNILDPLKMDSSGINYEVKDIGNFSKSYKWYMDNEDQLSLELVPREYTNLPGATSFLTTGADMSKFLQMYLRGGEYKGKRILNQETIERAFNVHFTYDEQMPYQQGLGWRILFSKDMKNIYHKGDKKGVESSLVLFPEDSMGLFTAFNSSLGYEVKEAIFDSISALLRPNYKVRETEKKPFSNLDDIVGTYYYMNDGESTFEKISYLFGRDETVKRSGDTLMVFGYQYLEIEPLLFDIPEKNGKLKFIKDSDDNIRYMTYGTGTYQKFNFWTSPKTHLKALLGCFLFITLALLLFAFRYFKSLKKSDKFNNKRRSLFYWILAPSYFLLLFLLFLNLTINYSDIGGETPILLKFAISFVLVSLIIFPVGLYKFWSLHKLGISPWQKILLSIQLLGCALILIVLHNYNFVGYHFY